MPNLVRGRQSETAVDTDRLLVSYLDVCAVTAQCVQAACDVDDARRAMGRRQKRCAHIPRAAVVVPDRLRSVLRILAIVVRDCSVVDQDIDTLMWLVEIGDEVADRVMVGDIEGEVVDFVDPARFDASVCAGARCGVNDERAIEGLFCEQ